MEYTTIVAAPASDPAGFKYIAPYTGSAIGQHWMYKGQHVADRLRRPVQAGRGLPRRLAAAAPPAGPRGLPRRRLLPALAAARALREALRRARRRLDDRPADHRDQGQRRLGLHPDQRHLDHRRPDLPRDRPVQLRCPAGHQRRHLGVPGRRLGAGQGDEVGRRPAAPRPRAVPRARGVRRLRLRPRRGVQGRSSSAVRGWSSCSSSRSTRRSRSSARSSRSGPAPPASSTTSRSRTSAASRREFLDYVAPRARRASTTRSRRPGELSDDTVAAARAARSTTFKKTLRRPSTASRSVNDEPRPRRSTRPRTSTHDDRVTPSTSRQPRREPRAG